MYNVDSAQAAARPQPAARRSAPSGEMTDFMTVTLDRDVETFTRAPRQLFIDGKWADAASGKSFETPNPATGETLAHIAEGDAEDVNRRSGPHARHSSPDRGRRMTPSERGRIIWRIGDLILEHADELAQLESLDNGKPFAVAHGRGRAAGRGPVPLHGRLGHQDRGQLDQHLRAVHARR